MITLQPLIGISCMPNPLPQANGIECFRLVSMYPDLAEISRKQEVVREASNDLDQNTPARKQERNLARSLPTPSLTPKM